MSLQTELKYSNIPAWHAARITGKGINVMNLETPGRDGHCEYCTQRIKHAAPDAVVYETGLSLATSNGTVTAKCKWQGKTYDVEDFIRKFNIKILTRSVGGSTINKTLSNYWNGLKAKYNLIFFTPAGNKGTEDIGGTFPADVAIYVGACTITDKGKIVIDYYSSRGEELELVNFTGEREGTSFAAPYTAGMAALILQKYGDLTQDEVFEYLKSYCKDLEEQGHDINSGWGVPIMGEPKTVIKLWPGKKVMTVDGREVELDQPPIINKDSWRTLVPVRAIAEAFGADVKWNQDKQEITIER